jgi:hypothetical protein
VGNNKETRSEPRILRGTIDRVEGSLAVIVLDGGGQVLWPKELLAEGAKPGVAVALGMVADEGTTAQREQEVRDLLKDIFGET